MADETEEPQANPDTPPGAAPLPGIMDRVAKARAAVLERTGYQTLIEEATDGWMVLARPTETLDPNGGEAA